MGKKELTREYIIQALKELEAEGKQPVRKALERKGINGYQITKLIPEGLTQLKLNHGIKLSPQEQHHSDNELLKNIDEVVSHLRRVPTWAQLRRETKITDKVFLKQFGKEGKQELFSRYRHWLQERKPESENIKLVDVYLEGQYKTKSSARSDARRRHQPSDKMTFVNLERIKQLRLINSDRFDLKKLVKLCEELNECYSNKCYFAISMLTRSILDHVPPIFSLKYFVEVANNYHGTKSFKSLMGHLENSSRAIADASLHTQIRDRETLLTATQVNFSNDLDVLLAEIIRLLK